MIRPLLSNATHVGESGSQLHPCNCLGLTVTVVLQVLHKIFMTGHRFV